MTSRLRRIAGSPRFIFIATVTLATITVLIGRHYCLTRADWPGWLQAVGSIWAILVAVWVSWQQAESQRQRDEDAQRAEINGLIKSLLAEVETTLQYAGNEIAGELEQVEPGTPFLSRIRLPEYPFPIFDTLIPRLGTIGDDALRRQIVHGYSRAKSFALTLNMHSDLVSALHTAEVKYRETPTEAALENMVNLHDQLTRYSDTLREMFEPTRQELRSLLNALSRARR